MQYEISLQDFQDAEPDVLAHSTPRIVERFSEKGISCNVALKALCKKKGLNVEVKLLNFIASTYNILSSGFKPVKHEVLLDYLVFIFLAHLFLLTMSWELTPLFEIQFGWLQKNQYKR